MSSPILGDRCSSRSARSACGRDKTARLLRMRAAASMSAGTVRRKMAVHVADNFIRASAARPFGPYGLPLHHLEVIEVCCFKHLDRLSARIHRSGKVAVLALELGGLIGPVGHDDGGA